MVEGRNELRLYGGKFFFSRFVARPEESAKTVATPSGNDMEVKVRHALAHDVVHGDESAVGFHCPLDRLREHLAIQEQRPDQV